MKVYQVFRIIMMIGLSVLLVSCGTSDSGDDNDDAAECNCDKAPAVEKSGLVMTLANQEEEIPANVSVLFKVETDVGVPLTNLKSGNFRIFEDDDLISEYESRQEILPKPEKFKSHTLLLLDLSGSVLESESLPILRQAARSFVDAIMPIPDEDDFEEIEMGIWWFDGAADIHPLVPFVTDTDELISGINTIDKNISSDSSTNLYGAVIQGIAKVEDLTGQKENIVNIGSVVIFTDGNDQASRRTKEDALKAVDNADSDISVYTIGLGGEIDKDTLKDIGRDDFLFASDIDELVPQFEKIADDIREDVRSYYLLEYCSPKRKGSHDLKISATHEGLSGSLTTCFCAKGFKGGCEISGEDSGEI